MPQFRKKPVVIEAQQFDGTFNHACQLRAWIGVNASAFLTSMLTDDPRLGRVDIRTLEGTMSATAGDWIIQGVAGEFYPIKADIFAETYEAVDDAAR